MCGISGIIDLSGNTPDCGALVRDMVRTLSHRGPDHEGVWSEAGVGLGHARLSIIDLSQGGKQPMASADGRYVMTYNGELYNYRELRAELENAGKVFRSHSDTEVLLEAYCAWGLNALPRFNGIFAFAIWDTQDRSLLLVRDRFGVKPLHYARLPRGLVFGSEAKALLKSGRISAQISMQGLGEFGWYGVPLGENTMFEAIHRVEPGHWLKFDSAGLSTGAYWCSDAIPSSQVKASEAARTVTDLLESAVKRQLVSDVPIGIFLSGGIDSSAVTAFATRHYSGAIRTYSVGFDFALKNDELPKAAAVAKHFGTDHHELHVAGGDIATLIETLVRQHDAPFSDAANIPLYLLCQALNGEPRVVLQGDGGDEIFGGYRRYSLLARLGLWQRLAAALPLIRLLPGDRPKRIGRLLTALGQQDAALRMALLLSTDTADTPFSMLLSKAWRARQQDIDPFARYRKIAADIKTTDAVQQMLLCDTSIILPDVFLEKVDRATMAWGIEARVPFLDNDLTDYVIGLPAKLKVQDGSAKALLKHALRGIVPDFVLDAPKSGFGVPYSHWLATSLYSFARETLAANQAHSDPLLDVPQVLAMLERHRVKPNAKTGFMLWKALNLAIWQREYLQ